MACILAIDTAGPEVGVAVSVDGKVSQWSARVKRGAESALGEALSELLKDVPSLDGVVVSVGPGSFTSLRVGVATALGFALASDCKVLPICSLRARALGKSGRVFAMLDGRKGRAYAALFVDGEPQSEAVDLAPEEAISQVQESSFVAVGEGASVWSELVLAAGGTVGQEPTASPVAQMVALFERHQSEAVAPEGVRLRYSRAPDAKLPKDSPARGS